MRTFNKIIFTLFLLFPFTPVLAQQPIKLAANWHLLDIKRDSVFGAGVEKSYKALLKGKKAKPVVVAVIDGGVDINHEDLKTVIWNNPKEIAGNHKDDDHNGYVDDVHGWNFLGSAKGNVQYDNLEITRLTVAGDQRFKGLDSSTVKKEDLADFMLYKASKSEVEKDYAEAKGMVGNLEPFKNVLDTILVNLNNNPNPSLKDFELYKPRTANQAQVRAVMMQHLATGQQFKDIYAQQIAGLLAFVKKIADYHKNKDYNARAIIGDNAELGAFYGNNDVTGPEASHGTHVAGIISAIRDNGLGIDGITNAAKIMVLRVVPDGDERDKDVANAIRYAVDNGACIINMSFGKSLSPDKKLVDDAVKYAMSKDILIVHAAGNEGKNIDVEPVYPSRNYLDGGRASKWIEVGSSNPVNDSNLKSSFSNYGKKNVDVFAPGNQIYSTIPGSAYGFKSGSSMAAPVVTGIAALLKAYYPKLKAEQIKDILIRSVSPVQHLVNLQVNNAPATSKFSDLCISGGIVNAYQALELAAAYR
ncbi:Subtilase family protein [Pedobacter sp. ok626]|uniref:S8 family peptidase n=1 Tax=Pedobacter sp. ok626 TaxID=1761882 RepID=UPI0008842A9F|nr:S8 family peptidase [Pedobacter sp. ok626]SDL66144.1 Subtilase family protein [Pedobacter sp. ok626]